MSSNWPKVLVIWLAAASQISVPPANFVAMSVTKSVTNRVSPICVTKCFKMSFRRRFYLTPIFWFRSQFFRIFRSIPNFPFTFYNLKRKFLLIFLSRSRSNEVIGIKSLFYLFDLVVSLLVAKKPKLSSTYFATKIHHQHRYFQPLQTMHFISKNKISTKHENDFWKFSAELAGRLKFWYHFVTV